MCQQSDALLMDSAGSCEREIERVPSLLSSTFGMIVAFVSQVSELSSVTHG